MLFMIKFFSLIIAQCHHNLCIVFADSAGLCGRTVQPIWQTIRICDQPPLPTNNGSNN